MPPPLQLFIAYSRKDSAFLDELRVQLTPLERSGKAKIWYDGKIEPGVVWETAIRENLHSADIILLLVSADAIASDYFYDKELTDALARHAAGTARVVPLIVRPCVWQETRLGELQALPKDGKAVTSWSDRDEAYADAVAALTRMVNNILAERAAEAERLEQERQRAEEEIRSQEEARFAAAKETERRKKEQEEQTLRQRQLEEQRQRDAAEAERQRQQAETERRQKAEETRQRSEAAAKQLEQKIAALGQGMRSSRVWGSGLVGVIALVIGNWICNAPPGVESSNKDQSSLTFSDPFSKEMMPVKGGTFNMGSKDGTVDEKPVHQVTLPDFFLSKNEVTFSQFQQFMEANPDFKTDAEKAGWSSTLASDSWEQMKGINWTYNAEGKLRPPEEYGHPVIHVSWNDAVAFCEWLKKETGQPYRLPTEAEWEYAAGNGSKHMKYSWGNGAPTGKKGGNVADETLKKKLPDWLVFAGFADDYLFTAPVGQFDPNDFGLYDMSGNVWEWCQDVWHETYEGAPEDGSAWIIGGQQTRRVGRGGSWNSDAVYCRVSDRLRINREYSSDGIGFRLAR